MSFEDTKVRTLVDLDVDPLFSLPSPPDGFCDSIPMVEFFSDNANCSISDNDLTATPLIGGQNFFCSTSFDDLFSSVVFLDGENLWFEYTITSADADCVGGIGISFDLGLKDGIDSLFVQPNIGGTAVAVTTQFDFALYGTASIERFNGRSSIF
jgi:hypothetical protein